MKFSQRIGVRPRLELQLNEMSDVLRNRLWNAISPHLKVNPYLLYLKETEYRDLKLILTRLWTDHFGLPLDEMSDRAPNAVHAVRTRYFESEWWEVYDLVEFFVQVLVPRYSDPFIQEVNAALEKECSGYRLVLGQFVPITSPEQLEAVANAGSVSSEPFPHVAEHLRVAAVLIGKRPEPDYRNSIKESISAVEALIAAVGGEPKATLGKALKSFGSDIHPSLLVAFEKLYGYTSDAYGIRHALLDESKLEQEDAVFMLVACSAFISYTIAKVSRRRANANAK